MNVSGSTEWLWGMGDERGDAGDSGEAVRVEEGRGCGDCGGNVMVEWEKREAWVSGNCGGKREGFEGGMKSGLEGGEREGARGEGAGVRGVVQMYLQDTGTHDTKREGARACACGGCGGVGGWGGAEKGANGASTRVCCVR